MENCYFSLETRKTKLSNVWQVILSIRWVIRGHSRWNEQVHSGHLIIIIRLHRIYIPAQRSQWWKFELERGKKGPMGALWGHIYSMRTVYWWNSKVIVTHFATAVAMIQVAHHFYHDQDQKDIQNPKILHPPLLSKISLLCLLLHWYKSEIKISRQIFFILFVLLWLLLIKHCFEFG